jgi:hypothetical protein
MLSIKTWCTQQGSPKYRRRSLHLNGFIAHKQYPHLFIWCGVWHNYRVADGLVGLVLLVVLFFLLRKEITLRRKYKFVTFQVLTTASIKMAVFGVMAPYTLAEAYRRFRGTCCVHLQGNRHSDVLPTLHIPCRAMKMPRFAKFYELFWKRW